MGEHNRALEERKALEGLAKKESALEEAKEAYRAGQVNRDEYRKQVEAFQQARSQWRAAEVEAGRRVESVGANTKER